MIAGLTAWAAFPFPPYDLNSILEMGIFAVALTLAVCLLLPGTRTGLRPLPRGEGAPKWTGTLACGLGVLAATGPVGVVIGLVAWRAPITHLLLSYAHILGWTVGLAASVLGFIGIAHQPHRTRALVGIFGGAAAFAGAWVAFVAGFVVGPP